MGGDGAGGFTLRTTIAGVVGGTASEIGGGKFSNGAVSGAFVHMFNAEARGWRVRNALMANQRAQSKVAYDKLHASLLSRQAFFKANPTYGSEGLKTFWSIVSLPITLPIAGLSVLRGALFAETAVISYPVETAYGAAVVNDIFNESSPPVTAYGSAVNFTRESSSFINSLVGGD